MDHGDGVWSVRVPIPGNPLGYTLVYVVDTDRGPVLVDTGWDDPASYEALVQGLLEVGTSIDGIHGVLITHHHPDHHGLSGKVRDASGAWIAMHPADAATVRRSLAMRPGSGLDYLAAKLRSAGAPEEHVTGMYERWSGTSRPRPAVPDRDIVPGDLVDLPGRRVRAIWTPGHTPGHVCLFDEEGRRLFSGDHLLPEITPHVGLYGDPDDVEGSAAADPLGDYLASLERIGRLGEAEVLPAHQHTFRDPAARVRELLEHHAQRLDDLRELITGSARTPWQLAEVMQWNRPWEQIPFDSRNIAVSEAESHVRRLVKLGLAEPVHGTDPVAYTATD